MIDIKFIRANTETVRKAIVNKNEKADLDSLLAVDESRRKLQYDFDTLKAEQNSVSQIIAQKKRAKEDATQELAQMTKWQTGLKPYRRS
jgi:seryl-tRNA synthetase